MAGGDASARDGAAEAQSEEATQRKVRLGFALGVFCTAIIGLTSLICVMRLRDDMAAVEHSHEIRAALQEIRAEMGGGRKDAPGLAKGGFMAEGLAQETAVRRSGILLARLRRQTTDHPDQQKAIAQLEGMVQRRIFLAQQVNELWRTQGEAVASSAPAVAEGARRQLEISAGIENLERIERGLLLERKARSERTAEITKVVIVVGGGGVFAFVVVMLVAIHRDFAGSRRTRAALRSAHAQLESRVAERTAELARSNAALRENEANLAAIITVAADGIVTFDSSGRIETVNPAAAAVFGYSRQELLGRDLAALLPQAPSNLAEDCPPSTWLFGDSRTLGNVREASGRRHDGTSFPLEIVVAELSTGGARKYAAFLRDITGRKHAEAEIAGRLRLEAEVSHLAATVPGAIYTLRVWPDGRVAMPYVSAGWEVLTGLTSAQVHDDAGAAFQLMHPDDAVRYQATVAEAGERLGMVTVEFRLQHPHRGWIWLEGRSRPERAADGSIIWHGYTSEITARKRAELALQESEERLRLASEAASIGVWESDMRTGRILWSEQQERMMDYAPGTFSGRVEDFIALIHPDDRERHREARDRAIHGDGVYALELRFQLRSGRRRWGLLRGQLWRDAQGRPERLVGVDFDITEQKQTEERVRQLNVELEGRVNQRTAELQLANQELEAFSYSVSHDLRAPLRLIDGFSVALLEDFGGLLPSVARKHLDTIRTETQRMGQLISDLLTFSRLSRTPLRTQPVDMAELARSVAAGLRAVEAPREIILQIADLPPCAGDPALLKQVWVNLIANALKYSRRQPVAHIEIGAQAEGAHSCYYVRDNGAGFDMRYVDKLFGVFQRLHRAEEYEGTGVGLAIVQRLVQRHGGRVWAEAAVGAGATFHFSLPASSAAPIKE